MTSFIDRLGPGCPECGEFAPFWKTQWGLGKKFICKHCGTSLVIPKAKVGAVIGMICIFYLWKDDFAHGPLAFFAVILAIGLPVTWLLTKPKRAE